MMYESRIGGTPVNAEAVACRPEEPSVGDAILRCRAVLCDCHRQASLIMQALEGTEAEDPINEPAPIHLSAVEAAASAIALSEKLGRIRDMLCS